MNWQRPIPLTGQTLGIAVLALSLGAWSGAEPAIPEMALPPHQATTIAVDTIWEARPHWAQEGYGTLRAATAATDRTRTFEVHCPGQCAVWWRPFDQPVSVPSFPVVCLRVQATGLSPDSQGYLVSLLLRESDGTNTKMRGVLAPDELSGGQPGEPHLLDLRTLGEFDAVLGVKVELWAASQGAMPATLSLLPIAFLADGTPPAEDAPEKEFAFVVRDRDGEPVPACQVTIDYEDLNARVSGETGALGRVALKTRHAAPNHTASFHAPGFLPLELAELEAAESTEVSLVSACQLRGALYLEGQPTPGVVQIDTKTPRPVLGRSPRLVFAAANRQGQWQAEVPAEAFAWLVRAGAHGGGTQDGELSDPGMLAQWGGSLNLPRANDTGLWLAPTPAWLLREGDNDTIAAMADDCAETASWRAKATAALVSVALSDPDAGDYYLLDLARLAARTTDQPYAGQAADCLLAILRRAGIQPTQAADYLREKAGGSLPATLRQLLGSQAATWNQVIGKASDGGQSPLAEALPAKRAMDRESVTITSFHPSARNVSAPQAGDAGTGAAPSVRSGSIDLFGSRRTQPKAPEEGGGDRQEPVPSRSTGAIDFGLSSARTASAATSIGGNPATAASEGGLATTTGGASPDVASVPVTSPGVSRSTVGGTVSIVPASVASPSAPSLFSPPPEVFTVSLPSLSRTAAASANLASTSQRDQGQAIRIAPERGSTQGATPWTFARAGSSAVRIGSQSSAAGAVAMPGASAVARDALALDFTSLADARSATVENALVRNQWEQITALVQQADYAKARAAALALADRLTTQDAILAYLPLLALTDADSTKADRNAVSACLDAMGKSGPQTVANAYAACLLHCYRRGDFEFAQELHTRYRAQFPDAKPSPAVLLALSLCHIKRGEQDQAHTHLATIVHDFPATEEAPRAALLLGWIDLSRQKYPEARATLEALVQAYPTNPCAAKAKQILQQIPQATE